MSSSSEEEDGNGSSSSSSSSSDTAIVSSFVPSEQALPQLRSLPSHVLSTVNAALHPNPSLRPSAADILGIASLDEGLQRRSVSMEKIASEAKQQQQPQDSDGRRPPKPEPTGAAATATPKPRMVLSMFPESFSSVHRFLSTLLSLHFDEDATWKTLIECAQHHLAAMVELPDSCFQVRIGWPHMLG